jgi:hypothetical protein
MNTPLFNLLRWFKENQSKLDIPYECIETVESYIPDEKAEIIKAREDGIFTMINGSIQDKQLTSEDYYNRTYSSEKNQ